MALTNIQEIDILILFYIDDDYQLYEISNVNKYLQALYENDKLWSLKINRSFEGLSITSSDIKNIYFNINEYKLEQGLHYGDIPKNLESLVKYARKNNVFPLLDWVWDYYRSWFSNDNLLGRFTIENACKNNNLDLLKYTVDKFGTSEEKIIEEGHSCLGYIKIKDKCLDVNYKWNGTKCLHQATINNHIKILNYFEKHGILYDSKNQSKTPLYPHRESIEIACKRGHFETVAWCKNHGLY